MSNPRKMRHIGFLLRAIAAYFVGAQIMAAEPSDFHDRLNAFGFNLAQKLDASGKDNLLISPASIELALGMVYGGASGDTATEMSRALGLTATSRNQALSELGDLQTALTNPGEGITLKLANAAWVDQSIHLNKSFASDLQEKFNATLQPADFSEAAIASQINRWVSTATGGKISHLLDNPPPPPLFLANAIYFHAKWNAPFDKQQTQQGPFHPTAGQSLTVSMMHRTDTFPYAKGPGFAVLALPYAGSRFAMYCFLPDKSVGDLIATLQKTSWRELATSLRPTEGSVTLPKFKMEYGATLNNALVQLGFGIAFNPTRADFERITNNRPRLYISDVLHKALLEVDEEGSTAAAVTGITMRATAIMQPKETFNLVFDHPFVTAIVDTKTSVILFLATVAAPSL
jgi:serine protease inhibitor